MRATQACVVVAEDDALQREVLIELLELEGYRALGAATPGEVLKLLAQAPDVVLLDLVGVATPAVRSALHAAGAPDVILVSGDETVAEAASRMGASAFVIKPFEVEELLQTVRRVLTKRGRVQVA